MHIRVIINHNTQASQIGSAIISILIHIKLFSILMIFINMLWNYYWSQFHFSKVINVSVRKALAAVGRIPQEWQL